MKYYYKSQYVKDRSRKNIQERIKPRVVEIKGYLESYLNTNLRIYWTRKNTLGYVFADFEFQRENKREWIIGKGEKDLFEKIKDEYFCLVIRKKLDRNYVIREIPTDGSTERFLEVNIDYFKEFLSVIRDRSLTVGLFLYKFTSTKEEELIRGWLRNYPKYDDVDKYIKYDVHGMMDVLQRHNVEQPNDLETMINFAKLSQSKVGSNPKLYEQKLERFKTWVSQDVEERMLHNFLFDNPWMIDIQYQMYNKERDKQTDVGNLDIYFYKDVYGFQRVAIIELKKSTEEVTKTSYRGEDKPAIIAEVGNAISQTIHYIENAKKQQDQQKRSIQGIVIVGRKTSDKDNFIETFNDYLHGIKVMTYDDVIESATSIVSFLKEASSPRTLKLASEESDSQKITSTKAISSVTSQDVPSNIGESAN